MQFRPRPSAAANRNTYIPPSVQQSMNRQLQQNVPAHLKKYVGTGAYVPQHAQKALQQHMQKNAPGHLKQYAGAFVQQNIVQPALSGPAPAAPTLNRAPVPNQLRRDHSNVPGSQYEVEFTNLFEPDQTTQNQIQPGAQPAAGPAAPQQPHQAFDFILNPEQPQHRGFNLPGGENKAVRYGIIAGGLILALILFNIIKGVVAGGPDFAPYVTAAQDQQELIHLATAASKQQDLSVINKNYTLTAKLSLTTSQSGLITYLARQHHKVRPKTLNLKVSASTDKRLLTATAAGTYNQTYHEIVESKLKNYINDLDRAYKTSSGKTGRALLKDDYVQAQLLLKQLNTPAT